MSDIPQKQWPTLIELPPRPDIPRASEVITECSGSVLMPPHTYLHGRECVNALSDVEHPALQVARWKAMEAALLEIQKGEGAYSSDPLTHASNTIENMKAIATQALTAKGGE